MGKKFGIASFISLIIVVVLVSIAIMTGAFNYVRHTNTVIDETNQTLQVVISDGVKEHPAYNANLPDIYLPNIPKQNFNLPVMNSDTYFTFKVWGGTDTEDKTYGFASVYDYSYMNANAIDIEDLEFYSDWNYVSRKWMAFQQLDNTISLTNVAHLTGVTSTPFTGLTHTMEDCYKSTGNLGDFNKASKYSFFKIGADWYMLEWKTSLQYVCAHHFKALCLKYLDELGDKINERNGKNVNLLMNEFCDVYSVKFKNSRGYGVYRKIEVGGKINANIIAPATFIYYPESCDDSFVLTQNLKGIDY